MQTLNTAFERVLTRLIEEELEKFKDRLASGMVMTFEDYKFEAGRIAGFRLVLGYFEEVNKILDES